MLASECDQANSTKFSLDFIVLSDTTQTILFKSNSNDTAMYNLKSVWSIFSFYYWAKIFLTICIQL